MPGGPLDFFIMRFGHPLLRGPIGSKGNLLAPEAMMVPGIADVGLTQRE